jgi:hypothetical protein
MSCYTSLRWRLFFLGNAAFATFLGLFSPMSKMTALAIVLWLAACLGMLRFVSDSLMPYLCLSADGNVYVRRYFFFWKEYALSSSNSVEIDVLTMIQNSSRIDKVSIAFLSATDRVMLSKSIE